MNPQVLLDKLRDKAKNEQRLTLEVIDLIRQVDRSKVYLEIGYGSLFDFVTKDLGYEPSSAMRRIHAARLIQEIPQLVQKISKRELSLTVVSQAQSFFRRESKVSGRRVSPQRKKEVLKKLENKSTREAEKVLVSINPVAAKQTEKRRELTENLTELKIVLDKESCEKLEELKKRLAHQNPDMTDRGLIEILIKKAHKEIIQSKPNRSKKISQSANNEVNENSSVQTSQKIKTSPPVVKKSSDKSSIMANRKEGRALQRRPFSKKTKDYIWERDQGCCQYRDPRSGRQCRSKAFLEIDHIKRVREGGGNEPQNLRLLCRNHNQWRG